MSGFSSHDVSKARVRHSVCFLFSPWSSARYFNLIKFSTSPFPRWEMLLVKFKSSIHKRPATRMWTYGRHDMWRPDRAIWLQLAFWMPLSADLSLDRNDCSTWWTWWAQPVRFLMNMYHWESYLDIDHPRFQLQISAYYARAKTF